jgi:hypothetical protein
MAAKFAGFSGMGFVQTWFGWSAPSMSQSLFAESVAKSVAHGGDDITAGILQERV